MERDEAAEALESIDVTRRALAPRLTAPRGYYAYLSVGAGLLILSAPLESGLRWVLMMAAAGVFVSAMYWYRNSTGTWSIANVFDVSAWRFWLMILPFLAGFLAAAITELMWVAIAAAIGVVLLWSIVGPIWDRDFRRQVEDRR